MANLSFYFFGKKFPNKCHQSIGYYFKPCWFFTVWMTQQRWTREINISLHSGRCLWTLHDLKTFQMIRIEAGLNLFFFFFQFQGVWVFGSEVSGSEFLWSEFSGSEVSGSEFLRFLVLQVFSFSLFNQRDSDKPEKMRK